MTDTPPPAVFAWLTGERTNIGDSLLRRPYLAALRPIGPVNLWINRSEPQFLSGLGLVGTERLTPGFATWYTAMIGSALRRRTIVVINAGELRVHASRVVLLSALFGASLIARLRGGGGVWIGASVPPSTKRVMSLPVKWAGRCLDYVQWREAGSNVTAAPRAVGPDWAFAEGSDTASWQDGSRPRCAFVVRGDRPEPTDAWLDWARSLCADNSLSPTMIVQVRQDADRAQWLAERLEGEVVEWPDTATHREQEEAVRSVYRESLVVVGDRLHGLIMGATEGAVPLGWIESSTGKVDRHLSAVGIAYAGEHEGSAGADLPRVDPAELTARARSLREAVEGARRQLASVHDDLRGLKVARRPSSLERLRPHRARARSRASRSASE